MDGLLETIIDMVNFFDYIFYSLFIWNRKLDNSFKVIAPIDIDPLFSAVFGLSVAQAMNLFTVYNWFMILLDGRKYLDRVDYI